MPSAPAYGVVISQLIRYARACHNYADFLYRARLLTIRLASATGLSFYKIEIITTEVLWNRHTGLKELERLIKGTNIRAVLKEKHFKDKD